MMKIAKAIAYFYFRPEMLVYDSEFYLFAENRQNSTYVRRRNDRKLYGGCTSVCVVTRLVLNYEMQQTIREKNKGKRLSK